MIFWISFRSIALESSLIIRRKGSKGFFNYHRIDVSLQVLPLCFFILALLGPISGNRHLKKVKVSSILVPVGWQQWGFLTLADGRYYLLVESLQSSILFLTDKVDLASLIFRVSQLNLSWRAFFVQFSLYLSDFVLSWAETDVWDKFRILQHSVHKASIHVWRLI